MKDTENQLTGLLFKENRVADVSGADRSLSKTAQDCVWKWSCYVLKHHHRLLSWIPWSPVGRDVFKPPGQRRGSAQWSYLLLLPDCYHYFLFASWMWVAAKRSHHCDLCHALPTMINSTVSQNRPPLPAVASDQHHITLVVDGPAVKNIFIIHIKDIVLSLSRCPFFAWPALLWEIKNCHCNIY